MRPEPRVLVVTSQWPGHGGHGVPFLVEQVEQLRRHGVGIDVFAFRGAGNPARHLAAWWRLHRKRDLRAYDLVHVHFGQCGLVALPCPRPLVVTFRGSDLLGIEGTNGRQTPAGLLLRRVSRLVARRADRVLVVAPHLRAVLPRGVGADVVPSGVDLELFAPQPQSGARRALGLPADGELVLFVGSARSTIKRRWLAEAAVAELARRRGVQFVVVESVPHTTMPLYMNACDALLLTSTHEGSPNVVKEALACNLPIVSLPVGDVPKRLARVDGCEVCPVAEPGALAAALDRVLGRGRLSFGREEAARVSHEVVTPRILEIYRQVAGRAEPAHRTSETVVQER
jgi:glycosyltransferase involved in cell wall biosynthesis